MISLPGYWVESKISETEDTSLFRVIREKDNTAFLLKIPKDKNPLPQVLARFRHEFRMLRSLEIDGILKAHHLEEYNNTLFILFEDFNGIPLNGMIHEKPLSQKQFLPLAIKAVEIIGQIHAQKVIHKNINPSNILFNPDTQALKILDFGSSTMFSYENSIIKKPTAFQGSIPYISPEQTGRMNRLIDYRTDFYSLGATFYELLCGKPPFVSDDTAEVIYSHIAKWPEPLHLQNQAVHPVISGIIMKLLSKNAENRYQSARGIQWDLQESFNQLKSYRKIEDFTLAQKDKSAQFRLVHKLYGRQREMDFLMDAFDRTQTGGRELFLVAGPSGIGKTSLIKEVHKTISIQNGLFISGKFNQYGHEKPYMAFSSAFSNLARRLLGESDKVLKQWRLLIKAAVGPIGRVITDFIPEMEGVLGPQPPIPKLSPVEARNRFNLVFQKFLRSFCRREYPLVIFIDDIQWADPASLMLIKRIFTDDQLSHFLFIGAYRDMEIPKDSPFQFMIDFLRGKKVTVNRITLQPLKQADISQLVIEVTGSNSEKSNELAEILISKTGGNPFFLELFLKDLYAKDFLRFNDQKEEWEWDKALLKNLGITENVVDLVSNKINRLDPNARSVLKMASCIGNPFDLQTLRTICGENFQKTIKIIRTLVSECLVLPIDDAYKIMAGKTEVMPSENLEFIFTHQRIQNLAYSLLDETVKKKTHFKIGRYLKDITDNESLEDRIFDIVNHMNIGINRISDQVIRDDLAILNLKAGKKAKGSTAFELSLNYFQTAIGLIGEFGWQRDYHLALSIFIEAAEAAYLCGQFSLMYSLSQTLLENAQTLLDQVKVYEVILESQKAQYQLLEALETAKLVLGLLNVKLPKKPDGFKTAMSFFLTKMKLTGKKIEKLIDLKEMKDPTKIASMRILASVSPAAYFAKPDLIPFIVFKAVRTSVRYGNTAISAPMYAAYGMILCGVLKNIDDGYCFGQLALKVLDRFGAEALKAKTYQLVNAFIRHWKEHLRETLKPFLEGFQAGLETGDFEFAGYCAFFYFYHSFVSGCDLEPLAQEIDKHTNIIDKFKHETPLYISRIIQQTVANLAESSPIPYRLVGDYYNEDLMIPRHEKARDRTTLFNVYFSKFYLSFIFRDYSEAFKNAEKTRKYIDAVPGIFGVTLFYFLESLTLLNFYDDSVQPYRKEIIEKVSANQKRFKNWAHHAPMNHLQKYYLVEAEKYRILNDNANAATFYDKAIEAAKTNRYRNDEALANELAFRFYLKQNKINIAKAYFQEARYGYLRWSAVGKAKDLETQYNMILGGNFAKIDQGVSARNIFPKKDLYQAGDTFDLNSVIKVAQAISKEIETEKLLTKIMKIVLENAGAQRGFLLFEDNKELVIQAEGDLETNTVNVLHPSPVSEQRDISKSIINYVARTCESVILNNAACEGSFKNDPHIQQEKTKSVMCMPISFKSRLIGILYMENNLIDGAFTSERMQIIKLLINQIPISLENAKLYSELKESEYRYRQLYENIIDMVILVNNDDQILLANPKFYEMIGISRKKNQPIFFKRWIYPDDIPHVEISLLSKLGVGMDVKNVQFRLQNRKGQVISVECNARGMEKNSKRLYQMVIRDITDRQRLERKLIDSLKNLENARTSTILGLAKLAEYRDEETGSHLERIREYALILTKELSRKKKYSQYITESYIDDLYFSSILHDIGKVGIPDSILLKPGKLTKEEFEIIKQHSKIGGDVLREVNKKVEGCSFLQIGMDIAYYHHEKWNGNGYPKGLRGEEIPLSARIISLVDVYDALTSKRVYKDAFSHEKAKKIIIEERGKHFDPEIVDVFMILEKEFDRIRKEIQE